jgi:hypothetical protein
LHQLAERRAFSVATHPDDAARGKLREDVASKQRHGQNRQQDGATAPHRVNQHKRRVRALQRRHSVTGRLDRDRWPGDPA